MIPPDAESIRHEAFLGSLKKGAPLKFLSSDDRLQRTIPAKLIKQIVTEPDRTIAVPVEISNAIIDGALDLRHVTFKSVVTMTGCEFTGPVDFSSSTFEHNANLNGSKFTKPARFRAATMKGDLRIDEATFADDSKFTDIHVDQVLSAEGTTFGSVNFYRIEVVKRCSFQPLSKTGQLKPTVFTGDAYFGGANFQGNVDFGGTQFKAKADFNGVRIGRNAFFRPIEIEKECIPTRFVGEANFYSVQVQGDAFFRGAQFGGNLNFSLAKVDGTASFATVVLSDQLFQTTFGAEVNFYGAVVRGNFDFSGAHFRSKSNFTAIKIDGDTRFGVNRLKDRNVPTQFCGEANFFNAQLKSNVDFQGCEFVELASFERCHITGNALFRSVDLGGTFVSTTFKSEARFFAANIEGDADFQGAQFQGRAVFNLLKVGSRALFQSIVVDQRTNRTLFKKEANFNRALIQGDAQFNGVLFKGPLFFEGGSIGGRLLCGPVGSEALPRTEFAGDVRFVGTRIESDAEFSGAVFKKETKFDRAFIGGAAWFNVAAKKSTTRSTVFVGPVSFYNAQIKGDCDFRGAKFGNNTNFSSVTFGRGVRFETLPVKECLCRTRFRGEASFYSAAVSGDLNFNGVQFNKKANFTLVKVEGEARFREVAWKNENIVVRFGGEVSFFNAHLDANCYFVGTHFEGRTVFDRLQVAGNLVFRTTTCMGEILPCCFVNKVSFVNAHIDGEAEFQRTVFSGEAVFDRAEIDGVARFAGTDFRERLSLRDAKFHIFFFEDDRAVNVNPQNDSVEESLSATRFKEVDLRGFSYDSMSTDWRKLFARMHPYDRQPFSVLEKNLRTSGDDRGADDAYLLRREQERSSVHQRVFNERRFREFPKLLFDWSQWLFNYGVRPYRLLVIGIAIIALGVFVFTRPHAVKKKTTTPASASENSQFDGLNATQALGLSLHLFSPVDIASGSEWEPTQELVPYLERLKVSYAGYASFHRIAGFILVPLLLIVLTGLLRRQAKP